MAVWNIKSEITEAADKLGIVMIELSVEQATELRKSVTNKFIDKTKSSKRIWETLPSSKISSYQAPLGWRLISNFVEHNAVLFFLTPPMLQKYLSLEMERT